MLWTIYDKGLVQTFEGEGPELFEGFDLIIGEASEIYGSPMMPGLCPSSPIGANPEMRERGGSPGPSGPPTRSSSCVARLRRVTWVKIYG
jgi:hypothetical protein